MSKSQVDALQIALDLFQNCDVPEELSEAFDEDNHAISKEL